MYSIYIPTFKILDGMINLSIFWLRVFSLDLDFGVLCSHSRKHCSLAMTYQDLHLIQRMYLKWDDLYRQFIDVQKWIKQYLTNICNNSKLPYLLKSIKPLSPAVSSTKFEIISSTVFVIESSCVFKILSSSVWPYFKRNYALLFTLPANARITISEYK